MSNPEDSFFNNPPQNENPFLNSEEQPFDQEPEPKKKSILRHPVALLALFAGAAFLFFHYLPEVLYMFGHLTPTDCGSISDRPLNPDQPPLPHDAYCSIDGFVQSFAALTTGSKDNAQGKPDPKKRYFVKLDGDRVFAVLQGDEPEIEEWRIRHGSLLGFHVKGPGRVIDPDQEPEAVSLGQSLHKYFAIPDQDPIRIYDTTDHPGNRWIKCVFSLLMILIMSLSALFLIKSFKK